MFYLYTPPKCVVILTMIVLGIASQKQATAAPPELINLYFAEQNRSHCDHLVVAILQGTIPSTKSKEGHVVSLFPPGNTGTKNLPKEGLVIDLFPPGNDGSRTDTGGGTGSGDSTPGAVSNSSSRYIQPTSSDLRHDFARQKRKGCQPSSSTDLRDDFARQKRKDC